MDNRKAEVIIVDDVMQNRLLLEIMLFDWQEEVYISEAENGVPVLEMIINSRYKNILVLLDLQMPVMDGYAFLDAWNSARDKVDKNVCIIIISATLFDKFKLAPQFGLQVGYLEKPVSDIEFKNVINAYLENITAV